MLRQLELEAAQEKCRKQITFCERRISEGKKTSETQAATAADGSYAIQRALSHTLADVADRERELAAYRLREKSLQSQIDALAHPTAAQAAQRAKHQAALAALAVERWTKDAAVDSVMQKLRKLLEERAELTRKMAEIAALFDFAATADFDAGRFVALGDSLPIDLLAQSQSWLNDFFGQSSDKVSCTVGGAGAVLPETLSDSGIYRPGESVFLSKARAKMLSSDEEPKPLPGPVEMEEAAGNSLGRAVKKTGDDDFPVSGFIAR
jgi:hypothetical protein